jgi:hypothetical protein
MAERIRITVGGTGQVGWSRGGNGMSTREFVENYPCKALKILTSEEHPDPRTGATDLLEAIISAVGGAGNLIEFNNYHMCGADDGILGQI